MSPFNSKFKIKAAESEHKKRVSKSNRSRILDNPPKPKRPRKQRKIPKVLLECGMPILYYGVPLTDIDGLDIETDPAAGMSQSNVSDSPDLAESDFVGPEFPVLATPVQPYPGDVIDPSYLSTPSQFFHNDVQYGLESSHQADVFSMGSNPGQSYGGYTSNQQTSDFMLPHSSSSFGVVGYDLESFPDPNTQYSIPWHFMPSNAQTTTMPADMSYCVETTSSTSLPPSYIPGQSGDAAGCDPYHSMTLPDRFS